MKNIYIFIASILFFAHPSEAQYVKRTTVISAGWNTQGGVTVSGKRMAFLTHLPVFVAGDNLPALVIYAHGQDHRGPMPTGPTNYGTLDNVATKGVASLIASGEIPAVTRPGGVSPQDDFKFAVIAAQLCDSFSTWPIAYFVECYNWAKANWAGQVDFSRVYFFGYSLGCGGAWALMGNNNANNYALISGASSGYAGSTDYVGIAGRKTPGLFFHGRNDPTAPVHFSRDFVGGINAQNPKAAVQYFQIEDLASGTGTQHDKIIQMLMSTTEGTAISLSNGDTWTKVNIFRLMLNYKK
jgi:hypothetical protein